MTQEFRDYKKIWARLDRALYPEKYKHYYNTRYQRAIESGICGQCKKNKPGVGPRGGRRLCAGCRVLTSGSARKYRTGATIEWWTQTLAKQNNHCLTCSTAKNLYVDHDHKTEMPRAILCQGCNFALGFAKESPEILESLAAMIRVWKSQNG